MYTVIFLYTKFIIFLQEKYVNAKKKRESKESQKRTNCYLIWEYKNNKCKVGMKIMVNKITTTKKYKK